MKRTRLKICCISSIKEADLAIAHGADALGLLGDMPSSPRAIDVETAREIAKTTPPTVDTFLLTASRSGDAIAHHAESCGTTAVQIVRHIDVEEYPRIINRIPSLRRVQVVHVEDRSALDLIEVYEPFVHAFILDGGSANAEVAELGGTGRVHNWEISSEFVRLSSKPVFLAGGLTPHNATDAISTVKPFGLDVCSGVRRKNQLDPHLLDEFAANVWATKK